jgi:hypothetical protein
MVLLVLGISLLTLAIIDALWTTLWVNGGGGPLSSRLAGGLWWMLRRATPSGRYWPLTIAGPVVMVAVFLGWVIMLWIGWTFVFSADASGLAYQSGESPDFVGRLYFTGYTLFTLGIGDIAPERGAWQVLTVVASGSGMLLITLGISYLISVLSAVVNARAFAASVGGLGDSAEEIVCRAWDGNQYSGLVLPLAGLSAQLDAMTQQHLAYPVLHYYHSSERRAVPALAVAVLDEALTILRFGVPRESRPTESVLEGARSSIENYLRTLKGAYVHPSDHAPRPPDLSQLRSRGMPAVSDEAFRASLSEIEERRKNLCGMVEADARTWPPEHS